MVVVIIPIGHDQSVRRMPWLTIGIIAICTLMQIYATFVAPSEKQLVVKLLAIEERFHSEDIEQTPEVAQAIARQVEAVMNERPEYRFGYKVGSGLSLGLFTSAFVHGGWLHLIGNMLFLWLAGSALEDRYGRLRFALFYLFGAAAGAYAYAVTAKPASPHLLIGASGAISACMGAFLIHYRKTEITFWYLLAYRSGTFRWPAWFALPLWLVEQFAYALFYGSMGVVSQVAYASHIGGFAVGMGAGYAMSKLFPRDADHDDVEYEVPSPPRAQLDAQLDERIAKLVTAIEARDVGAVRQLSSRVILDLARVQNDGRILDVYQALAKQFAAPPLTDGAFAAAAGAADRLDQRSTFVAIAGAMIEAHQGSAQLPKVMWRLAQLQREAGDDALAQQTLRELAGRFPRDEHGQRAQRELERSGGLALD
jgi:membrane associated rhomboid family serine protease